jgi:hypothetical protein
VASAAAAFAVAAAAAAVVVVHSVAKVRSVVVVAAWQIVAVL